MRHGTRGAHLPQDAASRRRTLQLFVFLLGGAAVLYVMPRGGDAALSGPGSSEHRIVLERADTGSRGTDPGAPAPVAPRPDVDPLAPAADGIGARLSRATPVLALGTAPLRAVPTRYRSADAGKRIRVIRLPSERGDTTTRGEQPPRDTSGGKPRTGKPAGKPKAADRPRTVSVTVPRVLPPPPATPPPTSPPPGRLTGYVWPLRDPQARLTTWFAPTDRGFVVIDGQRIHDGIDLATFCGHRVTAAHAGKVLHAGRRYHPHVGFPKEIAAYYRRVAIRGVPDSAFPIVVVIDDGNGYHSVYVHLQESFVKEGDVVKAGDPIGKEGNTGRASGCHLHYSLVRMDGRFIPVAPELVLANGYPAYIRERVDPLTVLSFDAPGRPAIVPGLPPPEIRPGLVKTMLP